MPRWQVVVFYPMDWEEDALHLVLAFSSMAHKFRCRTTIYNVQT